MVAARLAPLDHETRAVLPHIEAGSLRQPGRFFASRLVFCLGQVRSGVFDLVNLAYRQHLVPSHLVG